MLHAAWKRTNAPPGCVLPYALASRFRSRQDTQFELLRLRSEWVFRRRPPGITFQMRHALGVLV